jgi:hypothetical protein
MFKKGGQMTKIDEDHFMSMAAGEGFNSISNLAGDMIGGATSSNEGRRKSSGSQHGLPNAQF